MSNYVNPLTLIALSPVAPPKNNNGGTSFFEAMAQAWGKALDNQANVIQQKSDAISNGNDTPGAITELSAESLKMSFLANSSHTATSSVGSALETLARKQ